MNILSWNRFQLMLVFLTFLCSCSQQESNAQAEKTDKLGQELIVKPLGVIVGEEYKEKLFVVIDPESKKMGLIDSKNKEILPTVFDEIYSGLVNPYYVVVYENRHKGLFDLRGNRICESIYDGFTLSPSDSSIIGAYLHSQEKWRVINNKGEKIFSEDYAKIEFLQKGLVILQKEDYSSSLASINGESITGFKFQLLHAINKKRAGEKWYVDNDIVARAVEGLETIFVNSKGETVYK